MTNAYNIDCMEGMRKVPDKYFDLAVCDPPYFSGPEKRGYYGKKDGGVGGRRNYEIPRNSWKIPGPEYFQEVTRVSRRFIIWGCNYFDFHFPPGRIIWDKCNGGTSFSDCEIAATNCHDSSRMFRYMWNGMMQGKSVAEGHIMQGNKKLNEKRIHPTQKPVALYTWIFSKYAKKGDKILDSHLGSGSSRIAAYNSGLYFVGFEIDTSYFLLQEKRFEEYIAQYSLFEKDNDDGIE